MHWSRTKRLKLACMIALAAGLIWPFHSSLAEDMMEHPVTILFTNDFHGRHLPFTVSPGNATAQTGDPGRSEQSFDRSGRVGGFAALATAVDRIRQERGAENVLLLHGGDTFSDDLLGNLTKGEAVVRMMNAVGYQFMALGNHDFDYGVERTRELQALAEFPMRGANVVETATGAAFLGPPTMVFDVAGIRVGVLALGYHNTGKTGNPDNVEGLAFTNGIEAARALVPALRGEADIVLVLSHQGTKVDHELARQVEGIDLIVAAHSHDRIAPPQQIGKTWIAQASSDTAELGEMTAVVRNGRIASIEGAVHTLWTDRYAEDPNMAKLIGELRAPYRERLVEPLATAAERIGRRYKSESPFDVLVGNILRDQSGAEIAFLPGVGYGVSIEPGPLTREELYALLPHPSKIVTMTLSGRQIRDILEQSAANQNPATPLDAVGGIVQTAGLRWTADLRRPIGKRVTEVHIGERPLDPDRRYPVVTHSGMLAGIHNYSTFAGGEDIRRGDQEVVEIVEAALGRMDKLRSPALGSISIIKAE